MIEKDTVDLYFRLPNGNGCRLNVSTDITLYGLTQQIQKTGLQIPLSYQFVLQGKKIKNYSLSIKEAKIESNSIIHIHPKTISMNDGSMVDVAFLLKGDKFVVRLPTNQTIWCLKVAIGKLIGKGARSQTLIFEGKELKNNRILKLYKLSSDSLICLLINRNEERTNQQGFFNQMELVNSVCSLTRKGSGTSYTTLFRSDSINKKIVGEKGAIEVEVRERREQRLTIPNKTTFGQLFSSMRSNDLGKSMTFDTNLFQSGGIAGVVETQSDDGMPLFHSENASEDSFAMI